MHSLSSISEIISDDYMSSDDDFSVGTPPRKEERKKTEEKQAEESPLKFERQVSHNYFNEFSSEEEYLDTIDDLQNQGKAKTT